MIRSASLLALACTLWASAAHAQMSESDLLMRIDHLEAQLRELTGTVEQLQYRNHELEEELQRVQAAGPAAATAAAPPRPGAQYAPPPQYSAAPTPPAAGQYAPPRAGTAQFAPPTPPPYSPPPAVASAAPPGADADPQLRRGDAFNPALNPNAPGAPRPLGTSTAATEPPPPIADAAPAAGRQPGSPLDLSAPPGAGGPPGELPPPPAINPNATGAMMATLPPGNTPKDEYDLAYGYVLHKDYGPAADTFRDFLRKYPSDRLTPEAQYWLGESLFQQQQYRDAAESFLAVSTKYETTARAPDALLRLGQSLAALGEKEAACASLGEVLRKYPHASVSVKQNVDREQKRVHC
ncbi:MAG: tol-pal system protein YbgF [Xanthobacteraceae bacterium]|jgi:tol-pal system protein YbgF